MYGISDKTQSPEDAVFLRPGPSHPAFGPSTLLCPSHLPYTQGLRNWQGRTSYFSYLKKFALLNSRMWNFLFNIGTLPRFTLCTSFLAPHPCCRLLSPFPFSILSFFCPMPSPDAPLWPLSFSCPFTLPDAFLTSSFALPDRYPTSCHRPALLTHHSHTHKLSQTLLPFEFSGPCF